jgi:hypothetical protein
MALYGLRGSDIGKLPKTEEELLTHIEKEHHITVRREGETLEQAQARYRQQYPNAPAPDEKTISMYQLIQGLARTA